MKFNKIGNNYSYPLNSNLSSETGGATSPTFSQSYSEKTLELLCTGGISKSSYSDAQNEYALYKFKMLDMLNVCGRNTFYLNVSTLARTQRDGTTRQGSATTTSNCYLSDGTNTVTLLSSYNTCTLGYDASQSQFGVSSNSALLRLQLTGNSMNIQVADNISFNQANSVVTATSSVVTDNTSQTFDLNNLYLYFKIDLTIGATTTSGVNKANVYSKIIAQFPQFVDRFKTTD